MLYTHLEIDIVHMGHLPFRSRHKERVEDRQDPGEHAQPNPGERKILQHVHPARDEFQSEFSAEGSTCNGRLDHWLEGKGDAKKENAQSDDNSQQGHQPHPTPALANDHNDHGGGKPQQRPPRLSQYQRECPYQEEQPQKKALAPGTSRPRIGSRHRNKYGQRSTNDVRVEASRVPEGANQVWHALGQVDRQKLGPRTPGRSYDAQSRQQCRSGQHHPPRQLYPARAGQAVDQRVEQGQAKQKLEQRRQRERRNRRDPYPHGQCDCQKQERNVNRGGHEKAPADYPVNGPQGQYRQHSQRHDPVGKPIGEHEERRQQADSGDLPIGQPDEGSSQTQSQGHLSLRRTSRCQIASTTSAANMSIKSSISQR